MGRKVRVAGYGRDENGSALLEFALVLPILFALLAGCFELGRALLVRQTMLESVRSGARTLARLPDPACRPVCAPRAGAVLAATRAEIAAETALRPDAVSVSSDFDGETGLVAVTAMVRLHGDLLGAIGLAPLLTLSTTHREAWVAE